MKYSTKLAESQHLQPRWETSTREKQKQTNKQKTNQRKEPHVLRVSEVPPLPSSSCLGTWQTTLLGELISRCRCVKVVGELLETTQAPTLAEWRSEDLAIVDQPLIKPGSCWSVPVQWVGRALLEFHEYTINPTVIYLHNKVCHILMHFQFSDFTSEKEIENRHTKGMWFNIYLFLSAYILVRVPITYRGHPTAR